MSAVLILFSECSQDQGGSQLLRSRPSFHFVCVVLVRSLDVSPSWQVILNLPGTVEMCTPNVRSFGAEQDAPAQAPLFESCSEVYADQIEWMCAHINQRDSVPGPHLPPTSPSRLGFTPQ